MRVDDSRVRKEKSYGFKNIRIRVEGALAGFPKPTGGCKLTTTNFMCKNYLLIQEKGENSTAITFVKLIEDKQKL